MVIVDIDEELYEKVKPIVEGKKIEYPTLKNFINKAVKEKVDRER